MLLLASKHAAADVDAALFVVFRSHHVSTTDKNDVENPAPCTSLPLDRNLVEWIEAPFHEDCENLDVFSG